MTGTTERHPEEMLVERELQGESLGARDRQALDEHVRSCDLCRFLRLAASDFAREVPADAPPLPQLDRLIQTALWSSRPAPSSRRPAVVRHRRAPRIVAAAATVCIASFAAAHLGRFLEHRARVHAAGSAAVGVSAPATPPAPRSEPTAAPDVPAPGATSPQPAAAPPAIPPPAPAETRRAGSGRPWEELFRRATLARAQGHTQEALRLYGELARSYPRSPEGKAALAFKARLELDQGDARTAAADFDRYLAHGGSLEEEVLVGQAEAFRSLGRPAQEEAAWTRLVNRFPGSAHARRGKARLAELRSPP